MIQATNPTDIPSVRHYQVLIFKEIKTLERDSSWEQTLQEKNILITEVWVTEDIDDLTSFVNNLDKTTDKYVIVNVSGTGQVSRTISFGLGG